MRLLDHRIPIQFAEAAQLSRTQRLGMWVFLTSEVLLFSGIFLGYAVMRLYHDAGFREAARQLDVPLGTLNTAILLLSSWAVARAELAAEADRARLARLLLGGAAICGAAFLAVKSWEYGVKIHHGLVPGGGFPTAEFSHPDSAQLYFYLYFAMTGLHAVHLLIGISLLGFVTWRLRKPQRVTPGFLNGVALYWHLVDVVWVFLFPLFYLIG